jgi:hypothetical protein
MMAKDTRAEVLAAAEAARAAVQSSTLAPLQGFPGALVRVTKKSQTPSASQASLWDSTSLALQRKSTKRGPKEKAEPPPTLIQAALRAPPRPCPDLEREARVPMADREVILKQDGTFVVRAQVGDFSIFSHYVDGRRVRVTSAIHEIMAVCPEAQGTSSMGCILVASDGPRPGDEVVIDRWLLQQDERESIWRKSNMQHGLNPAAATAASYEDLVGTASAWLAEKLKKRPPRYDESDGFPRAQTRRRKA